MRFFFAEDSLLVIECSSLELQPQPVRHVICTGDNATRCGHRIPVHPCDGLRSVPLRFVRCRIVVHGDQVPNACDRAPHRQRPKDTLLYKIGPAFSADCDNHFAGCKKHQIGVTKLRTKRRRGFQMNGSFEDLARGVVGPPPKQIATERSESTAMAEQVSHANVSRRELVFQSKPGQMLGDVIIPT